MPVLLGLIYYSEYHAFHWTGSALYYIEEWETQNAGITWILLPSLLAVLMTKLHGSNKRDIYPAASVMRLQTRNDIQYERR